jgi:hypothetical protein
MPRSRQATMVEQARLSGGECSGLFSRRSTGRLNRLRPPLRKVYLSRLRRYERLSHGLDSDNTGAVDGYFTRQCGAIATREILRFHLNFRSQFYHVIAVAVPQRLGELADKAWKPSRNSNASIALGWAMFLSVPVIRRGQSPPAHPRFLFVTRHQLTAQFHTASYHLPGHHGADYAGLGVSRVLG